jgi:hypothetical protein
MMVCMLLLDTDSQMMRLWESTPCDVTLFPCAQALTERQPQLEKKPMRGRAPLSRKAVAALCVASFVVGLLFSGKVSLTPESGSRDGAKEGARASSGCESKRVSLRIHYIARVFASDRTLFN